MRKASRLRNRGADDPRALPRDTPVPDTDRRGDPADRSRRRDLNRPLTDALGLTALRSVQLLAVIAMVSVAMWGLLQVTLVVLPVMIALILACALWPLVTLLRRRLSPLLAAWVVLLSSFIVLGGILTGLYFAVSSQWSTLAAQARAGFEQVQSLVADLPITVSQEQIDGAISGLTDLLTSSQFGASALSGLSAAGNFLTGMVLLLVILFFFLKDGDRIWSFVLSWVARPYRSRWERSGTQAVRTFGGYIRGTAIIAAVDASGIGLALWLLGVPLALPLAVLTFIGAFIPLVGATFSGIIAVLVALITNGPIVALIALGAVLLVQQLEGDFLQPVVMGQTLSLHPLVILIALTAGTILGGLTGAVLFVPLTAVAWQVVKIWTGRDQDHSDHHDDDEAERRAGGTQPA